MLVDAPTFCPVTLGWPLPESHPKGPTDEEQRGLLAALGTTRLDWSTLGPHLAFDPSGYVRRRLFLNTSWEILLLCWLPGQRTVPHDHGASWGSTLVLLGDLVETTYRWHGQGLPVEKIGDKEIGERQITVETHATIHVVSNRSETPAVSLHLYSPPLKYLHAYDLESGERNFVEPSESRFYMR